MNLPNSIPPEFRHLFWDIAVKKFDPSTKPYYVVQRMLDKGDASAARWVEKKFGKKLVKETFTKIRDFSPRVGTFWQLVLNIPQNQVLCLQKSYREMRRSVWPY